ncbi:MAG TPA: hypothetical protein VLB83_01865 [Candidatus Paceibacterota bacterium]|nr:hypothetical protein [Candidatus Paceibacterota bacterium]
MMNTAGSRAWTIVLFLAVAILAAPGHLLVSDEGLVLSGAMRILSGEQIYTDFFAYIAPGSFYLSALAMAIFGASYWSAKAAAIALIAGSAYALADIARRLGARTSNANAAGIIWLFMLSGWFQLVNHNTQGSAIAVIGIALVLAALERKRRVWEFFGAGIVVGLVPVFLQTKGGILIACIATSMLVFAWKNILPPRFAGAAILGMILPGIGMLFVWPFATLFDSLITWPALHYREINDVMIFPFILIAGVTAALGMVIARMTTSNRKLLLAVIALAQAGMLASTLTRPDLAHVSMATFALPIFAAVLSEGRGRHKLAVDTQSLPFRIVAGFLLLFLFLFNVFATIEAEKGLDRIRAIAIRQSPGLYAYPFLPGYALELGQPNPYPHDFLFTEMNAPEDFAANLAVLEREQPGLVLRGRSIGDKFRYDWANSHDQWIAEHYEMIDEVGGIEILVRR